ncbi:hypothetical protein SAY86_017761 [Trapa natans]|uniref:Uncharacterized protein n=1 Tax=Trapa natans TaxID=22666 RepID=A0AAN7R5C9_TRANT|nr:hypothetical protein SAY86_017761 [Trapa natans]
MEAQLGLKPLGEEKKPGYRSKFSMPRNSRKGERNRERELSSATHQGGLVWFSLLNAQDLCLCRRHLSFPFRSLLGEEEGGGRPDSWQQFVSPGSKMPRRKEPDFIM